jgi:hypothetical protein
MGRHGLAHHRWMVGGTRCLGLNQWGGVGAWACATAHVAENPLQGLLRPCDGRRSILRDTGFHATEGDPATLTRCQRGAWQDRLRVETGLSRRTVVWHVTRAMHRGWAYVQARLAFTMAAFNILVQWHGFLPNASGFVPLSMAALSL